MKNISSFVVIALCALFAAFTFSTSLTANAQVGKACPNGDTDCSSGTVCEPATLKCRSESTPGQQPKSCKTSADCPTGLTCQNNSCAAVVTRDTCFNDSQCFGGKVCQNQVCVTKSTGTANTNTPTNTNSGTTTPSTSSGSSINVLSNPLKVSNVNDLIRNIINFVLGFVGVIAAAMIIYGGVIYMTSAGNDQRIQAGKSILTYGIVGLIISLAAGIIVRLVISAVGG